MPYTWMVWVLDFFWGGCFLFTNFTTGFIDSWILSHDLGNILAKHVYSPKNGQLFNLGGDKYSLGKELQVWTLLIHGPFAWQRIVCPTILWKWLDIYIYIIYIYIIYILKVINLTCLLEISWGKILILANRNGHPSFSRRCPFWSWHFVVVFSTSTRRMVLNV